MSIGQRETLIRAGVGLVIAFAAWRILTLGMADHFARTDPVRALDWRPDHPLALITEAELLAAKPSTSRAAQEHALAALRANPLEGRAYRVLGTLAHNAGDESRAVQLYELAAKRSPRDVQTHAWLERHYLMRRQADEALKHTDLMLRVEPSLREREFPILAGLAELPPAQAALARTLSLRPPWRETFLVFLAREATDGAALTPFMALVRKDRLSPKELAAWVDRLAKDGRWDEAYVAWVTDLNAEQQSQLSNVFNGSFEREPSGSGFDWRFGSVPGAYIERVATSGAEGELALLVGFDDRRVPFNHVMQLLALPPGAYRLELRARADGLRSERGLVWTVSCAEGKQPLGSTPPLRGHSPWKAVALDFVIPDTGCGGQWLRLVLPARIRAEQRIGGRAWFDDVRIARANALSN